MSLIKIIRNKPLGGFTIVETMIFLTISSVLFVSVSLLISGQLSKYQAREAMNNVEAIVRSTLNDVTNGYYPMMSDDVGCSVSGTPEDGTGISIVAGSSEKRGSGECVVLGKSIQFNREEDKIIIKTYVTKPTITTIKRGSSINATEVKVGEERSLEEQKEYKWGIKPTATKTFYILNTKLESNQLNSISGDKPLISGSLPVELFTSDLEPIDEDEASKGVVCFDNGGHKSSLEFLSGGALGVRVEYQSDCD